MSRRDYWDEDWMRSMATTPKPRGERQRLAQLRLEGPPRIVSEGEREQLGLGIQGGEQDTRQGEEADN